MIALTFDDGPNPATTVKLLDLREKNGVGDLLHIGGESTICESGFEEDGRITAKA